MWETSTDLCVVAVSETELFALCLSALLNQNFTLLAFLPLAPSLNIADTQQSTLDQQLFQPPTLSDLATSVSVTGTAEAGEDVVPSSAEVLPPAAGHHLTTGENL
mmetsp:Transcript_64724/g.115108  ORF Transcript_64724/g.115108 Transcript_64724/m.115108 type:complete len:105 (-) Transcript_64724:567-881(-)